MSVTTIEMKRSKTRERIAELMDLETRSDDERTELNRLTDEYQASEVELRAAMVLEPDPKTATSPAASAGGPTPSDRLELRAACKASDYLAAALGRAPLSGASAELNSELSLRANEIPFEILDGAGIETRADQPSQAPNAGRGQNLAPIQPFVFAASVAPMLGVAMPSVATGGYGVPVITGALTAAARPKGNGAMAKAATIGVKQMSPKGVSARLMFRKEDELLIGAPDFESALRRNLQAVLSAELDKLLLNDQAEASAPEGLIGQLAAATAATEVVTYTSAISTFAGLIDGLWARSLMEIRALVNADVMAKLEALLQVPVTSGANGEMAVAKYLRDAMGGIEAHDRMPDHAANVSTGVAFRAGSGLTERPDTAVCASWGSLEITDPYSDSASATTYVTAHTFVSDVQVIYPEAYSLFSIKTA